METLLYSLTFPPIILLALVVHEAGHMAAAILLNVKVAAFQIGIGPRIATRYTGKTAVRLPEGARTPEPGQVIHYWAASPDPEDRQADMQAAVWQPALMAMKRRKLRYTQEEQELIEEATRFNREHPRFTGRVRSVDGDVVTVADTGWIIAWFPVMAMVHVAEDPKNLDPGYFNTASWLRHMTIILAGVRRRC